MIHLTCHVCDSELFVDRLETAEREGWVRSVAGWICESYDCYQSCPHPRLGLHSLRCRRGRAMSRRRVVG